MNRKDEFIRLFSDNLSILGYSQIYKGVFRKPCQGFEYQINLLFTGKVAKKCEIFFGFWIKSVEDQAGKYLVIQRQRAVGAKNASTIFGSLSTIGQWADTDVTSTIDLDFDWLVQLEMPIQSIKTIETKVGSLHEIAVLATSISNLPLGHHAFRIPIFLKSINENRLLHQYIQMVKEKKFINDYDEFINLL